MRAWGPLDLLGLDQAPDLADAVLGVLRKRVQHRIERRLLGMRAAPLRLQCLEHATVVGVTLQLFPALPPEIADNEEPDPREQAVGPILQIGPEMDARATQRDRAVFGVGIDLDEPAVEEVILRAFEEDEAHAVGVGITSARVEQLEIEAPQPNLIEGNERRALPFDHGQPSLSRPGDQRLGMRADVARNQDSARERLIDDLDIGAVWGV